MSFGWWVGDNFLLLRNKLDILSKLDHEQDLHYFASFS